MKFEQLVTLLDKSNAKLTVKIPQDEVLKNYKSTLIDFQKEIKLDGFRQGKVPFDVIEKRFLPQLYSQTIQSLMDKSITEITDKLEDRPIENSFKVISEDSIKSFDINKDFSFEVEYDIYPKFVLDKYKGFSNLEYSKIEIKDIDIDEELKKMQEQQSISVDKKTNDFVEDGDIITIDYSEVDSQDKLIQGTSRQGFTFEVGTGKNFYQIDEEVKGMKLEETRVIKKEYPSDFEFSELRDRVINISVTLKKLRVKQVPQLDDSFASDIDEKYKTIDDLKNDISLRIKEDAQHINLHLKQEVLMEKIIEENPIVLPQSIVNLQLSAQWSRFVKSLGGNEKWVISILNEQNKSVEDVLKEWTPSVEKEIKSSLLISRIIEETKTSVSEEELEKEINSYLEKDNSAQAKEYYNREDVIEEIKSHLIGHKITNFLVDNSTFSSPKIIGYQEYKKGNYND